MLCPSCSAATNTGDRFCANCGSALEQRCGTCGTVLPDDARFCPSCGTSLTASEAGEHEDHAGALQLLDAAVTDLLDLGLVTEAVLALSDEVRIARSLGEDDRAGSLREMARGLLEDAGAGPLLDRVGL